MRSRGYEGPMRRRAPLLVGSAYVNFLTDDETRTRIDEAYGPALFERLRRIKGKYDPGNLFSGNLNIPPA